MAKAEKPKVDAVGILDEKKPAGNGGFIESAAGALTKAGSDVTVKATVKPPNPLADVVVGREFSPPKFLVYGIDGIGKSTWASQAPSPIFIQTEEGLRQIGAPRFPVSGTYQDVKARIETLAYGEHGFQTVVLDNASGLEKLIFEKVSQANGKANIDLVGGGFDKGQKLAVTEWQEILDLLGKCWDRGMCIIVIAHARSEKLGDPENPMAEQFAPALHRKTSCEMLRRWVDAIFFMTRRMTVRKEGQGIMEKQVAIPVGPDGGERVIRCCWTPTSVAKNRYDMPMELPFPKSGGFDLVMKHITDFYERKEN